MQFSETWLRSFVNPPLSSAELSHQLTMAGLEVEALAPVAPAFTQVVVAEIVSVERHPDADRLQVCQVNVGAAEPLQIVCGAPNARAGLKTACALVGAALPGFAIKHAKVRGVESLGMMCSAKELGMEAVAEGILEFAADAPVGQKVREYLDLDDQLFTLKLTPNRGDCLSITGVAREVAAITGVAAALPVVEAVTVACTEVPLITVADARACPRYCGRVVRGLNPLAVTPAWMLQRLARSGVRGLHPVVDITNFVLLERGQPLHAFDRAKVAGGLVVRQASAGESLLALNDQTLTLDAETLVIADGNGPVALAGIMGGQTTAVDSATTEVILEAAHFAPAAMAGRARRYGLSTDASHRFERGVAVDLPRQAMERATQLVLEICGGEAGPVVEIAGAVVPRAPIRFRPARARKLLGIALDDTGMAAHFARLGLSFTQDSAAWQVQAPAYRFDLTIEVDLIEEIARLEGYDRLPTVFPSGEARMRPAPEAQRGTDAIKMRLVARGWQEVITYSFIAPDEAAWFASDAAPITLLNPIASNLSVMRDSLLPGLVMTLRHNLNHGQERLRIFELGRCFASVEAGDQPQRVAGLLYGLAEAEQWGVTARAADFFDLKAEVLALAAPQALSFRNEAHPALHPGQCARLYLGDRAVGWMGALHPRLVQSLGLARTPLLFEIDLAALSVVPLPRYQRVPLLPSVRRDLAVLVDDALVVGTLLAAVRADLPAEVIALEIFDVYRGKGLPDGKKSLAFKVLLQHTGRTFTDAEIDALVAQVLGRMVEQFAAELRN
jgi:phenylalanyl-tRNA synthetase beta chain